ncbi:MAG: OB-fold nucleic acid binding domain-containing protein, partial [Sphingomonadales bacterium]
PLFASSGTAERGEEPDVTLPKMPLSEHVVDDYQTLRLSLKAHPASFFRDRFRARNILSAAEVGGVRDGQTIQTAGLVLVRQRPGTAKGVVFMTLEDETGIVNVIVWPKIMDDFRKVVMTSRLLLVKGRVQRHEDIIHLIARELQDLSGLLLDLKDGGRTGPAGSRQPGDRRPQTLKGAVRGHPRNASIMPKSRDFR